MRDVYIVGIGSTTFGRHADESIESLAVGAVVDALIESTVDRGDIGALYLGNFISGPLNGKEVLAGIVADRLAYPMCRAPKWRERVPLAVSPLGMPAWLSLLARSMPPSQWVLKP